MSNVGAHCPTNTLACLFPISCRVAEVAIEQIAIQRNVSEGSCAVFSSIALATQTSVCCCLAIVPVAMYVSPYCCVITDRYPVEPMQGHVPSPSIRGACMLLGNMMSRL